MMTRCWFTRCSGRRARSGYRRARAERHGACGPGPECGGNQCYGLLPEFVPGAPYRLADGAPYGLGVLPGIPYCEAPPAPDIAELPAPVDAPGVIPPGYKPPPTPVLGRASELKPTVGGEPPVVE